MSLSSFFNLFVPRLTELLTHLTMALGGRAGARLSAHLDAAVSRMSLLRSIRTRPETAVETPRVLGVDGFAVQGPCLRNAVG
ncbi:hypothetical protein GCM10028793_54160 [Nocardiopsis oceani]